MDRKIKASTLIEVIVSMTVIVIVFGIALMIFVNVTRFSLSAREVRARALLREKLLHSERSLTFENELLSKDSLTIEQEVTPYPLQGGLLEDHLSLYDSRRKLLAEIRKVEVTNE